MELPTLREIQLETLIREQDEQITSLSRELNVVRSQASKLSAPTGSEVPSLSPAWLAYLQAHVAKATKMASEFSENPTDAVTKALLQKTKTLQDENDELYRLLHISDAERDKEELYDLRNTVSKMERALSECHNVITSLSIELEESNRALLVSHQNPDKLVTTFSNPGPSRSNSPRLSPSTGSHDDNNNNDEHELRASSARAIIPTGPRGEKRARLKSEPRSPLMISPSSSSHHMRPDGNSNSHLDFKRGAHRDRDRDRDRDARDTRDLSPRISRDTQYTTKRESSSYRDDINDDNDDRKKRRLAPSRSPPRQGSRNQSNLNHNQSHNQQRPAERSTDRDRDRDKNRTHNERDQRRERERERERDDHSKYAVKNSTGGSSNNKSGRRMRISGNGDRTLAERMGL